MLNRRFFRMAGVMTATTVGAGLFSLPYVFLRSGWLTGIFYLAALSAALAFVHRLYFRVLEKEGGDERLLGLALMHLGRFVRLWGLLSIQGGLILALVIYLLLARGFSEMLFPGSGNLGLALFWLAGSLPLVFGLRRLIAAEILGAVMMAGMILAVFFYGLGDRLASLPGFSWAGFLGGNIPECAPGPRGLAGLAFRAAHRAGAFCDLDLLRAHRSRGGERHPNGPGLDQNGLARIRPVFAAGPGRAGP